MIRRETTDKAHKEAAPVIQDAFCGSFYALQHAWYWLDEGRNLP